MKSGGRLLIATLMLMALFTSANATDRLVLVELFTNTGCGYCYPVDLVLDQLAENYPDTLVALRYHVNWPANNDPYYLFNALDNNGRKNYYNVSGVPDTHIDGFIDGTPNMSLIRSRFHMEPPLEITLGGYYNSDSRTGNLNISLTGIDDAYWDSLYLRIALTESDLYYHGSNGLDWHHQVMRDMIPNATGYPIDIGYGETVNRSQSFTLPAQLVAENCEIVVFAQNDYLKEVYQTARIKITDIPTAIDDEVAGLPTEFQLAQNYPNPFNANTTISYSLEKSSEVELTVYDLAGRRVASLYNGAQNTGNYQVVWNGINDDGVVVSSGIYFYRLTVGGQSFSRQMMLLK